MPNTMNPSDVPLARWIDQQPVLLGEAWIETLDDRKKEEAEFHDVDRAGQRDEHAESSANRKYYEAATIVHAYLDQWVRDHAKGAVVLDYACGNGLTTIAAAKSGASLAVGIDISEVSVRNATRSAGKNGVSATTRFLQRDCENTGFPDNSFDVILCLGMLHHLDLTVAFPELHRVLRPGGRVFCLEALQYNPAIQFYRDHTPEMRTAWEKEHILGLKDLRFARQWFAVEHVKYFLMSAPLAALLPSFMRPAGFAVGHAIDAVLTRVPGLQLWSWQFAFELAKR